MSSYNFKIDPITDKDIKAIISQRDGEIKIGETIQLDWKNSSCKYVIIGVIDDIGPQANYGLPGASNGFIPFIKRFLNMQENRFMNGKSIGFYGVVKSDYEYYTIQEAREYIDHLDNYVAKCLTEILEVNKIPILIGGGHNNAYPLLKSVSEHFQQKVDCINLDPHADCRSLEGRHSGNPFSYAIKNEFVNQYTVFALHESYNNEAIYQFLDSNNCQYTFFEEYIDEPLKFEKDLADFNKNRNQHIPLGIELDLDSIAMMPTSAFTPSGFSIEKARKYIRVISKTNKICYLHLTEGAPTNPTEDKIIGKTLAYLTADFIKENQKYCK
jgi:formiminoglutamase